MLMESTISTGKEQQEILPMDMVSFPFVCSTTRLDCCPDNPVPWHWHNVFEINYVIKGELSWQTPDHSYLVSKGEIDFLNTGVLHTCSAIGDTPCEYYTILFDMHFLSGMYNSIYEEKYFLPLMRNNALSFWHIKPDSLRHLQMTELFLKVVELSRGEPYGYEFKIRSLLSDFWLLLLEDTKDIQATAAPVNSVDTERMKLMTDFIKKHCGEKLSLEDIAGSAGISTRECTRCFQRCINTSPNVFLTQTRVRMAADMLAGTSKSIIEISEDCGFSSPSYFTKVFREMMGCTPKDYREKDGGGDSPWYYSEQFSRIVRHDRRGV